MFSTKQQTRIEEKLTSPTIGQGIANSISGLFLQGPGRRPVGKTTFLKQATWTGIANSILGLFLQSPQPVGKLQQDCNTIKTPISTCKKRQH